MTFRETMIHKRAFIDEDCFELSCKHPKQWEYTNHLAPMVHMGDASDDHSEPQTSDDDGEHNKCQDQGRFRFESIAEVSNGNDKEFEISSGCLSPFFWANDSFPEVDVSHLSFFPEYFAPQHQLRALLQPEEIYSSLLDFPPLKPVSIGPEYQADVPEWSLQSSKNSSSHLDGSDHQVGLEHLLDSGIVVDDDEEKLMGARVIPMPDSEAFANCCSQSWVTRNECECLDKDSIRCVRQHVMEAREKLRESLGEKIFEELGFCDMGEELSKKWTEEEEKKFHEVVSSYRASMGKNFWDHLPVVFPSRTKKDLVSYYFNVFILQKCAEQNRFDPLNVDSDDDEWQRSEDEDSSLESLNQEAPAYYQEDHAENCNHDPQGDYLIDGRKDGANAVHTLATNEEEGDVDRTSEPHVGNFLGDSGDDNDLQL